MSLTPEQLLPVVVEAGPADIDGLQAITFCVSIVDGSADPIHGALERNVAIALRDALTAAIEAQELEL